MKTILVSGAGSGIGKAISIKLANEGYSLILLGRNEKNLISTKEQLNKPEQHKLVVADIKNANSIKKGLIEVKISSLSGIIANAGLGGENYYGPNDRWQDIIDTNLTGTYNLVNESLEYLKDN
ncbi:MAG: SDR family oxidoreductase, partial [Spirochaetes bacterium]|nr:SDR family oxidoreductase [Spirochaetota bacterium]